MLSRPCFDRKDLQCRGTISYGIRKVSQDIAFSLGYLFLTDARRDIELLVGDSNPLRCAFSSDEPVARLNHGSPKGHLTILCWQACLYWVWSERNARLHRDVFRSSYALICRIDRQIRDKILSFRETNPTVSSVMMQQWLP
ncbi:hypothetical protein F2Q69_00051937 [Brassica cretica]|uniref:Uncharacterized protein n=1 Tax=Brassica cretica TaxID=69181 RepID=A0A8S9PP09_BRACR|nr:hypothetical protein F2Q69_00051937 [Brassica cretica]